MTVSAIHSGTGSTGGMFGKVKGFFTNMNASEMANIHQAGKITQHEVPAGLGKLFAWAFKPVEAGSQSLLRKIASPLLKGGFKLLQLPIINKISPFMKYNLLFGAGLALVGSAYKLLTGRVTESIHGLVGNAITLGGSALAAFAIPAALGMSTVGGAAALIGFGLTMFVEPKIRKLVGLDKEEGKAAATGAEAMLNGATPASQLQNLLSPSSQTPEPPQLPVSPQPNAIGAGYPYAQAYQQYNPWAQHALAQQQQQQQVQMAAQQAEQLKLQQESLEDAKAQRMLQDISRNLKMEKPIT